MDRETLERWLTNREYETHDVGGYIIRLRSMTAEEVRRFYLTAIDNGCWKETLVAFCLVDEHGHHLFRPTEVLTTFANFNHLYLDAIYQLARDLTAIETVDGTQTRQSEIAAEQQQSARAIYETIGSVLDPVN